MPGLAMMGCTSSIACSTGACRTLSVPPASLYGKDVARLVSLDSSAATTRRFYSTEENVPYYKMKRDDLPNDVFKTCHDLIHSGRVVIFLTGTPEAPRCGFTRALVSILEQLKLKYQYVDIMESEEVCEGLKEYSGWPTYPQVYIDQELVGGFDVIKEMTLSGEFPKLLAEKKLL